MDIPRLDPTVQQALFRLLSTLVLTLVFSTLGQVLVLSNPPIPSVIDSVPVLIGVAVGGTAGFLYRHEALPLVDSSDTQK